MWSDEPMVRMAVFDDSAKPSNHHQLHWAAPDMASHWTLPHSEGKLVRLATFTNCDTVELFLNDARIGERRLADFPDQMIVWYLPYAAGTIRAVGKVDGSAVCTHELATAAEPRRLTLSVDRESLAPCGLVHLEAAVTDEGGILVPDASHRIEFEVEGPGELIGVDNGDLSSDEPFKSGGRSANGGRALAIVRAGKLAGAIRVKARAERLTDGYVEVEVVVK